MRPREMHGVFQGQTYFKDVVDLGFTLGVAYFQGLCNEPHSTVVPARVQQETGGSLTPSQ